jgi:hypothetical protein
MKWDYKTGNDLYSLPLVMKPPVRTTEDSTR